MVSCILSVENESGPQVNIFVTVCVQHHPPQTTNDPDNVMSDTPDRNLSGNMGQVQSTCTLVFLETGSLK